uniref:DUF2828 domain-containing protein n=1 Tax=Aegilops tauschii subsp. strangulata TaxID=200361 RepID=A0A453NIB4_AEGTS
RTSIMLIARASASVGRRSCRSAARYSSPRSSCRRAWESVVYTRVASVAMKNYQAVFLKHDAERFNSYLADVKSGKKRIAAGALLPHQIIESLGEDGDGAGTGVADMQWRRMVDDMRALGKLTNCMAVCDVSGSMSGLPMDVCVALGLLVSELTGTPWRGRVITFSERPEIHLITGDTLSEKVDFMRAMEWGMNTNFQAVFDKILEVAVGGGLPPEKMVRRVFVFSDMEFDQASAHPWETDYDGEEVLGSRLRVGRARDSVLEPGVLQGRAGDVRPERGGAGQRLLQELAQAVPRRRRHRHPEDHHGEGHRRPGVRQAHRVRLKKTAAKQKLPYV